MYINSEAARGVCDMCDTKPATVGILATGATGRVCEVMWICSACVPEGAEVKSAEAARAEIEAYGNGYPDF